MKSFHRQISTTGGGDCWEGTLRRPTKEFIFIPELQCADPDPPSTPTKLSLRVVFRLIEPSKPPRRAILQAGSLCPASKSATGRKNLATLSQGQIAPIETVMLIRAPVSVITWRQLLQPRQLAEGIECRRLPVRCVPPDVLPAVLSAQLESVARHWPLPSRRLPQRRIASVLKQRWPAPH
jgi:hypothetical protein